MASENETVVADIVKEMRIFKCRNLASGELENCVTTQHYFADRIEAAHRREIAELKNKCEEYERQPELMAETAKAALELLKAQESKIAELRECLKVAEDALVKLQDRLVSSVHDGTIDPHETLEIAENALAAIREEGCDPCNARDGEGSSLRIGWEGEKEYCVVAKYRQDLQVKLEDYDYHRVTGPLPLDIAKHWLDYHKRIRTKSEDPKILVREVAKWRLFDPVGEGSGK